MMLKLAQRLHTGLICQRPALEIFLDSGKLLAGDVWQQKLADEIAAADSAEAPSVEERRREEPLGTVPILVRVSERKDHVCAAKSQPQ